jgi:hypothetical protein
MLEVLHWTDLKSERCDGGLGRWVARALLSGGLDFDWMNIRTGGSFFGKGASGLLLVTPHPSAFASAASTPAFRCPFPSGGCRVGYSLRITS